MQGKYGARPHHTPANVRAPCCVRQRRLVEPHSYTIELKRTTEIVPFTVARRKQINLAQRPDKVCSNQTIHQRVVSYAEGY
jgi:hypothetical protein